VSGGAVRVAVVDIGSNSTRLLIAEVENDRITGELERHSTVTRLGAGVDADRHLREDAQERVFKVLDDYQEMIERHGSTRRLAVLTSAVRDSANGGEFAGQVRERYGLVPHVLSGDEEARLTFLGATSERDPEDIAPTLVFDIGGGSTEMVIGAGTEVAFHVSTQAGVVRQTERHLHHDPASQEERERLAQDVRRILADAVPEERRRNVERGIGVAGTSTSLAAIAQELEPYDPEQVHGYCVTLSEAERILERLSALPLAERREVAGLHPDRAPTIVTGAIIFAEVIRLFGLDQVEVSEHDILRGAALNLSNNTRG
jgi:exopolyphosphatase/guanosine-5'-triphosphate,3'-diphosphate pyrophosphatase